MRVSDLLTKVIPIVPETENARSALTLLRDREFEEYDHVYLVDREGHLTGQVPLKSLIRTRPETELRVLKGRSPVEVSADERAERAALLVIENHDADVAVVDLQRRLIGAIPVEHLLTFLHKRHINNIFLHGGIGARHHFLLDTPTVFQGVRARLPWLILGLIGGILIGGVASAFERALRVEISLAFFLPLVVYMSDAIGTQTETLVIRRMAARKVPAGREIALESATGLLIGSIVGFLALLTLYLWTDKITVAIIVGLAILFSAVTATLIASSLPLLLSRMKVDPAAASGPIATVIQDFLSVTIYLGIASMVLYTDA
ncbi:MAG TPA: magnesium transporter [Pyrinomonadaceae bacterium]|jgi:magnesium transporter|nr:magnesium transporter [Pyrinomonadaceae bacterium]